MPHRKIESKEVKLKRGTYNESSLVDKVCSEAQRKSYHHKERFASGKHQSMFLDTLTRYCDYEYDPETKILRQNILVKQQIFMCRILIVFHVIVV